MTDEDPRVVCPHCGTDDAKRLGMRVIYKDQPGSELRLAPAPSSVEYRFHCARCRREFMIAEPPNPESG